MSSPIIWGSTGANNLQAALGFANGAGPAILAPATPVDPTVTPVNASKGSLYVSNSTAKVYIKQDAGSTTNWSLIGAGSSTPPSIRVLSSGSGTYTPTTGSSWIKVRMVGGGAGGAGSGNPGNAGTDGTDTLFGSDLVAGKGVGSTLIGTGGTGSLGSITNGFTINGSDGGGSSANGAGGAIFPTGGNGGVSAFGGAGAGSNSSASAGKTNSGSGGGGGGIQPGGMSGCGGGAGAYVEAILSAPFTSFSYQVGAQGTGGAASGVVGTNNGADGGAGIIVIEEHF